MDVTLSHLVNFGFGWVIVLLSVIGYFLTQRRTGEKWLFWIVLAIGWGFFAVAQTLLISGAQAGAFYLVAIWLSSYVLVITSMVLLFVKLVKAK